MRKTDYKFHLEISEPWVGRVKDVMLQVHCDDSITDAGNGSNEERGRRRLNQVTIHNYAFCNVSWIAEISRHIRLENLPFDSGLAIQKWSVSFEEKDGIVTGAEFSWYKNKWLAWREAPWWNLIGQVLSVTHNVHPITVKVFFSEAAFPFANIVSGLFSKRASGRYPMGYHLAC